MIVHKPECQMQRDNVLPCSCGAVWTAAMLLAQERPVSSQLTRIEKGIAALLERLNEIFGGEPDPLGIGLAERLLAAKHPYTQQMWNDIQVALNNKFEQYFGPSASRKPSKAKRRSKRTKTS